MAISKVDFFGKTLVDLTSDTVDAQSLKAGYTAHGADGELVEGVLGKKLTFRPGSTLRLNVELADADGNPYTMAAGEVLKLHMWHGADTIDAESETTEVSVEVPADAPTRPWHWTLDIYKGGTTRLLSAVGDARCFADGDTVWDVQGQVSDSLAWGTGLYGSQAALYLDFTEATDYYVQSRPAVVLRAANCTKTASWAFISCMGARHLELPLVASVGSWSFTQGLDCESVELPEVTSIDYSSFGNTKIRCIELPKCASIGANCFQYNTRLRVIALPGDALCTLGGSILQQSVNFSAADGPGRIYVNDALVDDYKSATNWATWASRIYPISEWDGSIPESKYDYWVEPGGDVKTQLDGLLDSSIAGVFRSEKITYLRWGALAKCGKLTEVDLPNVTQIFYSSLSECSGLTSVNLPNLSSGGDWCFSECSNLARLDFPRLNGISYGMFKGCASLATLILRKTDGPASLVETDWAFLNTPIASGTGYIYVPAALIDTYKSATNWSALADQFRAIEDYPEICDPE